FKFKPEIATIECAAPSCDELEASMFTGLRKVNLSEVDPKLQKIYQDGVNEVEKDLRDNYFAHFRMPPEPDRRTYKINLKRAGTKEYSIALDYDNYEPWEVTFYSSELGPIFKYYSEQTRKSNTSPYDLERRVD